MKTLLLTLTYLVGAGELLLSGFFWKTNSGNTIRRIMSFFALVTGFWVISTAAASYNTSISGITWYRSAHVFGPFLVTTLFVFATQFPVSTWRLDKLHYVFIYAPATLFSLIIMSSTEFLAGFTATSTDSGSWFGGSIYWLYSLLLLCFYLATVIVLVTKYRIVDGIHRKNLTIVFVSIVLGGFPAIVTDVLFSLFTNEGRYAIVGSLMTVFWLGITSYIVLKK